MLNFVLSNLPGEKFYIVGASYGTPICYLFTQKYAEKVEKLILSGTMNGIPMSHIPIFKKSIELLINNQIDQFSEMAINTLSPIKNNVKNQELSHRVLSKAIKGMCSKQKLQYIENTKRLILSGNNKLYQYLATPSLVFTGEKDSFTLPSYNEEVAKELENSAFYLIKNSDHLFHMQSFQEVILLLTQFVTRTQICGETYL